MVGVVVVGVVVVGVLFAEFAEGLAPVVVAG